MNKQILKFAFGITGALAMVAITACQNPPGGGVQGFSQPASQFQNQGSGTSAPFQSQGSGSSVPASSGSGGR